MPEIYQESRASNLKLKIMLQTIINTERADKEIAEFMKSKKILSNLQFG